MECGESVFCGGGELELDPDIVSEEAGKLYSELQAVVETHGSAVVESLVPVMVWVLEGLASSRAQLREREEEAERGKVDREELMERYQSERTLRRESQEKYLELDDQFEQERRAMRGREKERERRERELERKAREQADQLLALDEQRTGLSRELNTLKHTHNKLMLTYRELLEKRKDSEREGSPFRNHIRLRSVEVQPVHGHVEPRLSEQNELKSDVPSIPILLEPPVTKDDQAVNDVKRKSISDPSFIIDIISSTPELSQLAHYMEASTPIRSATDSSAEKSSLQDEMKEPSEDGEKREEDGENREEKNKEDSVEKEDGERREEAKEEKGVMEEDVAEEDEEDLESLEWELRNTDSVFSELSELSREYLESVDQGASVRGSTDQFDEIVSQYEELKRTHEMVDAARKALICRVEELTNERSALNLEVSSSQETIARLEGRMREMEEETKRLRNELEAIQSDDPDAVPMSLRRFSRSEMARVVMEKNQYKERLFELQEAVRRAQTLRVTKDERPPVEDRKSSVWTKFNRLFGLAKPPMAPPASLAINVPTVTPTYRSPTTSPQRLSINNTQTEGSFSPRVRRRELYREIRSHVWGTLGKRQVHGWSMPLSHTNVQDSSLLTTEPKDVPVLVQLRLLDQRDATAKLTCAVAVTPEVSKEQMSSVWALSGPASSSDVTIIDPTRSNTILDQFSLPPTSPALCICVVPPTGETSGTIWIGTQDGGLLVHPASTSRRRCLQSVTLAEGVHSLTYSQGKVIAGLANGTLAFFSHSISGWDLQSKEEMSLGAPPVQPIRCCLAKGEGLWVGYWNKIHMIDVTSRKVEKSFTVSERSEQQVRFLCAAGSGVWASCRLDPTLRLFDWATGRPLQEVDLSPMVTKALGAGFLSLCPLQVSALAVICGRLWVGSASGAIFSVPLNLSSESSIPYCTLALAQLCYHGHRQAVKFIISAPGCHTLSSTAEGADSTSQLILSGGEGYINFRIGDDASDGTNENAPQRSERSHMIIWQSASPSVPNPAL
ncbi:C-Jun-amino-terminal kinase-interacting protein 4 [Alosa sapidissima]|uniref:C-Jun-amino-terminal kinase-interacting protein 4 n=1 Tax=Alosa sapidissima TaxID=34773 RepID=UPI001C0A25DB|nr:C-Jun-amino-terminal kinase-interacting protein 4 [Alosa sapidissima]XP_041964033.1 C-Jun-amino-terminal kinase-interacting protein 4 [Alosa sapidissima]